MKSIGLSDEVYELLLHVKHTLERARGEVMSYDKVIRSLIEYNSGEDDKDGDTKH
jgi:hypothetical protein